PNQRSRALRAALMKSCTGPMLTLSSTVMAAPAPIAHHQGRRRRRHARCLYLSAAVRRYGLVRSLVQSDKVRATAPDMAHVGKAAEGCQSRGHLALPICGG